MRTNRCYQFTHVIARRPGQSVAQGLRAGPQSDPSPVVFLDEHNDYIQSLARAGVSPIVLPALEQFPDSVFVEDAALCIDETVVVLRPGASSRFGEADALAPDLHATFESVVKLQGGGSVDGGDILLTDAEAFIGLSARTDTEGLKALKSILDEHNYRIRIVNTPTGVLHFKSDCGLLDNETIFSTKLLAASGCFDGYNVLEAPDGEEAAANLIRVNDFVLLRSGFPETRNLLQQKGYKVLTVKTDEAAKLDGGLSCMSLRFSLSG